jgi:hypothetical protein
MSRARKALLMNSFHGINRSLDLPILDSKHQTTRRGRPDKGYRKIPQLLKEFRNTC